MGSIKECYLQYKKAGDQYLGGVVSRLDVNDISFVISSPYFESGPDDDVKENVLGLSGEVYVTCYIFALPHFAFISITW